mgnify:CR=1 FL=1
MRFATRSWLTCLLVCAREYYKRVLTALCSSDLADSLVADIGTGEVDKNDSRAVWQLIVTSVNEYKKVCVYRSVV